MTLAARLETVARRLASLAEDVAAIREELQATQPVGNAPGADTARETVSALVGFLAITPPLREDTLLNTILQCSMYVTGARGAGLTLLDPQKRKLIFKAAVGDGAAGILGYEVPLEGSQHGLAFVTGEVQAAAPLHAEIEAAAGTRFRNVLVAPLMADGEPIGTLSAVNKEHGESFTVRDMEAYKLFSDLAALVVRQRLRESQLRQRMSGESAGTAEALANLAWGPREQELLELTDQIARLAQRSSSSVATLRQIVTALERAAVGPVR
jgi:GAF domain-containing protein